GKHKMRLPIELAQWQFGYVLFLIVATCLAIEALRCSALRTGCVRVLISGVALMLVGIASIFFDFSIIMLSFEQYGNSLLSKTMAATFAVMMLAWAGCILVSAVYFALRYDVIKTCNSMPQLFMVMVPTAAMMIIVTKFTNHPVRHEEVQLLREIIFVFIPVVTVGAVIFGRIMRRMTQA
ncbi:MAG: hypothetical protein U9Q12_02265, partial [Patescibacteria group bacterium]|nr:hypothetical protein [Patescibacteria group bacterium]